jgi:hypothetical protein
MKRTATALVLALMAMLFGTLATTAQATEIGYGGCTPGYWKNHTDNWQEARPDSLFTDKFDAAGQPVISQSLSGKTFWQTLEGGGGPGVTGAESILARAATAAYLNAAHEDVQYPWRRSAEGLDGRPALVPTVRAAINSGDRATMIALASRLDTDNNRGCFLN